MLLELTYSISYIYFIVSAFADYRTTSMVDRFEQLEEANPFLRKIIDKKGNRGLFFVKFISIILITICYIWVGYSYRASILLSFASSVWMGAAVWNYYLINKAKQANQSEE